MFSVLLAQTYARTMEGQNAARKVSQEEPGHTWAMQFDRGGVAPGALATAGHEDGQLAPHHHVQVAHLVVVRGPGVRHLCALCRVKIAGRLQHLSREEGDVGDRGEPLGQLRAVLAHPVVAPVLLYPVHVD